MATKQDLDAKEAATLAALQELSTLVTSGSGSFDTAPEIATLVQMDTLIAAMKAKLQGGTGVPGIPVISSPMASLHATIGVPFSAQVTASGSPVSYSAVGFPAGFSIDSASGVISGTASVASTSQVTLTATNSLGSGTASLTLVADNLPQTGGTTGAPVISSPTSASGQANALFTYQVSASNSPTSFAATGLPAGLQINSVTGVIFGTPAAGGSSVVSLSATNASGTGTAVLTLTVNP